MLRMIPRLLRNLFWEGGERNWGWVDVPYQPVFVEMSSLMVDSKRKYKPIIS
jgi:hypothetical protein